MAFHGLLTSSSNTYFHRLFSTGFGPYHLCTLNKAISSLLLKSNRMLGGQLTDCGLISLQQLEAANTALLDRLAGEDIRETSLLKVLLFEQKTLDENDLLNYQIEHRNVAGVSLRHYHIDPNILKDFSGDETWATWTLPIDEVDGVWFLASAYYMSPFVRRYWSDKLRGEIVWCVAPMLDLDTAIDQVVAARAPAEISHFAVG